MNKKFFLPIIITLILIIIIGTTYAAYTYTKTSTNQELVAGNIYLNYNENNVLSLTNIMPSETYDENDYFEFTIKGKNGSLKDIWYDISLTYGDPDSVRTTRIEDKFLKFTLIEIQEGVEAKVVDEGCYSDLSNQRIYVNTIAKNTKNEISLTYRLYMWISDDIKIGNLNQDYTASEWEDVYASIKVKVTGDFIEKEIKEETFAEQFKNNLLLNYDDNLAIIDGTYYLSGTNDVIDFNYVWYSGKLWRITSIDPNGSIKLITDDAISAISYNPQNEANFYTDETNNSYVYQWLNQDFLKTLYNYENIIDTNSNWYSLDTNNIALKINETVDGVTTYQAPVGLLNSYEYYTSYRAATYSTGFLNIGYYWWLLNNNTFEYMICVTFGGNVAAFYPFYVTAVRPVINLKPDIFLYGEGTKTNPYYIQGDKPNAIANTTLLNTRMSGEYVKFDNNLYRIVSVDENKTKLIKYDYIRNTSDAIVEKAYASSSTYGASSNTQSDTYWDYYLNNTWYNSISSEYQNMMTSATYYLGQGNSSFNYKTAICSNSNSTVSTSDCSKTTNTWTGLVGLPRYGEMFAAQHEGGAFNSKSMWLITKYSNSYIWYLEPSGEFSDDYKYYSTTIAAYPTITLKSEVKITSGTGLKDNPYLITLG